MKLLTLNQELVNVNITASKFPRRAKSKSILQGQVGEYLDKKFPRSIILEEFFLPESRLSLDFFIPQEMLSIEVDGRQHEIFVPFLHQDRQGYGKQIEHDRKKEEFCLINNIKLIRIRNEEELAKLDEIL